MTFEKPGLDAFVPYGDDRAETARTLVALADKHNISQSDIHAANDGFYISEALADLLYEDNDSDDDEEDSGDAVPYDPIAADRERIRLAEEGAAFSQASAIVTEEQGVENAKAAEERVATNEAEAAQQAADKAALAEQVENGPNPYEDDEEETEPVDYSEWEYPALKHEASERNLDTKDQKADTLIAALTADDKRKATEVE